MPNTVNPANSRIGGGERLYCHHIFLRAGSLEDPEIYCQMMIDRAEPFTSAEDLSNWMQSKGFSGGKLFCGVCGNYNGDLLIGFFVSTTGWLSYHGVNTAGSTEINSSEFSDVVI